jgi:hypothetical protein
MNTRCLSAAAACAALALVACQQPPEAGKVSQVTAVDLYDAFARQEIAAGQKFGGKSLLVSGTVSDVGRDIAGTAYVALATSSKLFSVQCSFPEREVAPLAGLHRGDRVRLRRLKLGPRCETPGNGPGFGLDGAKLVGCCSAPTWPAADGPFSAPNTSTVPDLTSPRAHGPGSSAPAGHYPDC